MNTELINNLTAKVLQQQVKQPWLTIEEILNHAGVYGVSLGAMVEVRAAVYYRLGRALTAPEQLKEALAYFTSDYPVFRWSELRYYFKGDPKAALKEILKEFKYQCRYIPEQTGSIWAPARMWNITIKHQLANRTVAGDTEYFHYLNYTPKRLCNSEFEV